MTRALLAAALLLVPVMAQAGEPEYVNFGGKEYMHQRVVAKSGIDTDHARIETEVDRKTIDAMCKAYADWREPKVCVEENLKGWPDKDYPVPAKNALTAKCSDQIFSAWGYDNVRIVQDRDGNSFFDYHGKTLTPWYNQGLAFAWKALCPSYFDEAMLNPNLFFNRAHPSKD